MRTCGMDWGKCNDLFGKCATKGCAADEACLAGAEAAHVATIGGGSHMTVCKAFRDGQHELCECMPLKVARESANARLADFYAAHKPDRLDDYGQVRGADDVWKKWRGREPELFFELSRKYAAEAVEFRPRPGAAGPAPLGPAPGAAAPRARSPAEEEAAARRQAEEDEHLRQRAEELEQLQAMQEALARREAEDEAQERELERRRQQEEEAAEALARRRWDVAQLRAEKADAVAREDYLRAKALKAQLAALDPGGEL